MEEVIDQIPTDLTQVKETLVDSLGGVWLAFLGHLPFLAAGLLVLVGTGLVAFVASRIVERILRKRRVKHSLKELAMRFTRIAVWSVGLLLAAMIIFPGLTPTKAIGGLGLLSVAVGFAFKDIFENFFAGVLLLWRFPFENGDFIECEGLVGKVEAIEIRMTRIRKTTGELCIVPNSFLFKNLIELYTSQPKRRIHLSTGVSYDTDVDEAIDVIEEAVKSSEKVDKSKPIQVFAEEFGDSSINIDVAWWHDSKPVDQRESRSEVLRAVKKALEKAGMEIPFPYRTLTFKEPLPIVKSGPDDETSSE